MKSLKEYRLSNKKLFFGFIILIISVILIVANSSKDIDKKGEELINHSLQEAVAIYAVSKALNGVISVVQGTEISPPGLTITIGEILDPINDLVERFSWIMLLCITSLGIQKIFINIVSGDIFVYTLMAVVVVSNILYWFDGLNKTKTTVYKTTALLLFLKFVIPIMTIANGYVYEYYIKQNYDIQKMKESLTISTQELQNNSVVKKEQNNNKGFLEKLTNKISDIVSLKFYKQKIKNYKTIANNTSEYIINLVIVFIFKTIVFPLIFIYMLYRLVSKGSRLGS
ncbi:MAG: hypothetical protein B1H07_01405 [Campylobacteraceae bacterium 4484_166]|nr:MAG: hypothetical protein B1H07_01405 [Campylobacteraceae bacterium 4484_166]